MKDFMASASTLIGLLIIGLLIISIPFGVIWAVNYLFGFSVAYGFKSWVAVVIILLVIDGVR